MSEIEVTLTAAERKVRNRFVEEYLVDFNPIDAAIRCGYSGAFAKQYSTQFLSEPYTLKRLKERQQELGLDKEEDQHRKRIVAALYREANRYEKGASHGARVAALSKLSTIFGLEAPIKTKTEHTLAGPPINPNLSVKELEEMREKLYGSSAKSD